MTAVEPVYDHGDTPRAMGFEQLLELECTLPIPGPGESEDEALSQQVIEGAIIVLEEAAKEAQLSRYNNHHKVLIFACYRLYKYVDCNERKLTSNDRP